MNSALQNAFENSFAENAKRQEGGKDMLPHTLEAWDLTEEDFNDTVKYINSALGLAQLAVLASGKGLRFTLETGASIGLIVGMVLAARKNGGLK